MTQWSSNSRRCTWCSAVHTAAHSTSHRSRAHHAGWNSGYWLAVDIPGSRNTARAIAYPCTQTSSYLPHIYI